MGNSIGIIIQARIGSTRLPRKMVLNYFDNKGIFENLLIRLQSLTKRVPVILATTDSKKDDILVDIAEKHGFLTFRGNEDNVLMRFVQAAKKYNLERIIRVCADNPFIDITELERLIDKFDNSNYDYYGYTLDGEKPTIKTGYGFWAEGVTTNSLNSILNYTSDKIFLEHVTNYIYEHKESFKLHLELLGHHNLSFPEIRLTVDTLEDFNLSRKIFHTCMNQKIDIIPTDLVLLIKRNPVWLDIMQRETERNKK